MGKSRIKLPMQFFVIEAPGTIPYSIVQAPESPVAAAAVQVPDSWVTVGNRGLDLFVGAFFHIEFRLRVVLQRSFFAKLCETIQQDMFSACISMVLI